MAILPGSSIGILGGGQLGRMIAMAARSMGYGVVVLDPDPNCASSAVADRTITAGFDDPAAAAELAKSAQVVTYEIEKIGEAALVSAEQFAPVRPGRALLRMIQDRASQKDWLKTHGFAVGPFVLVNSATELAQTMDEWRSPGRLKIRRGGYDGRGQVRVQASDKASSAWSQIAAPAVFEQELELKAELSVLVARRPAGEIAVYPPAQNWHHNGILTVSLTPGVLPRAVIDRATEIAHDLAKQLALVGLLAVEFFLTEDDQVLVNELSPRPHNTFHTTEAACQTSQFEQLVRAICDLPLGATDIVRPCALANLLGDLWLKDPGPDFEATLGLKGVRLNLYGKSPRPGRKVGHLLASAATPEQALELIAEAERRFSRSPR